MSMIDSFKCKFTEEMWKQGKSKRFPASIHRVILRKLVMLDSAAELTDLQSPPGDRLEALKGNRKGQQSIRINDQWRICFRWSNGLVEDVEIIDYH